MPDSPLPDERPMEHSLEERTLARLIVPRDNWAFHVGLSWDAFAFIQLVRSIDPMYTIDTVFFKALPSSLHHDVIYLVVRADANYDKFKKDIESIKKILDGPSPA